MNGFGRVGVPDDIVCLDGVFVSIEYKAALDFRDTKTALRTLPRASQIITMDRIRESGGITLVVDINNIDQLEGELLKFLKYLREHPRDVAYEKMRCSPLAWNMTLDEWKQKEERCSATSRKTK